MENKNALYSFDGMLRNGILVRNDNGDVEPRTISKVLIPMLQRPYAQGRKSQSGIREKFIREIFDTICRPDAPTMELNFLYGAFPTKDSGTFELLDGQQRLTTLFLLHWYVACREKERDEQFAVPDYLNRFSYETRTSSTDFLKKLVGHRVALNDRPSRAIRRAVWYSKGFDKDTTVDGMLRMLDCIDAHYQSATIKPRYQDLYKLQFYVLELNGFGLTEELFIKMNARGLQLTPFENFKADLMGYLKREPRYQQSVVLAGSKANRQVPYWLNFSSQMDGAWQDLFWARPQAGERENAGGKESDRAFFRFIQRYFSNKIITLDTKAQKIRDDGAFRFFSDNTEVERHEGFAPYENVFARALGQGFDMVAGLSKVLTFLTDQQIGKVLLDSLQAPWADGPLWKPWDKKETVSQRDMIRLAAMTEYVELVPDIASFDVTSFKQWMRIVHNLVANTDVNGEEAQIILTRLLKNLLVFVPDNGTSTLSSPYQNLIDFYQSRKLDNRYLEAEATKARAIQEQAAWEDAFIEAEKDKFMRGFVTFYYEEGMSIEQYRARTARMPLLFDSNGVTEAFRKDFKLMRAFYSRMYDWTKVLKNKWFLLATNDLANRELKNQTIWNNNPQIRSLFCSLLDCKDTAEMEDVIASVLNEEHQLLLRENYWSESAARKLNKAYHRLCRFDEMKVLKWLYESVSEQSMRIYVCADGMTEFYKGSVNSMIFSDEYHRFIPSLIDACREDLDFRLSDDRQAKCRSVYGNYNGNVVKLQSSKTIGDGITLQLEVRMHNEMNVFLRSTDKTAAQDAAKRVFDHLRHLDNGTTLDKEGKLTYRIQNGEYCYPAIVFNYSDEEADKPAKVLKEIMCLLEICQCSDGEESR